MKPLHEIRKRFLWVQCGLGLATLLSYASNWQPLLPEDMLLIPVALILAILSMLTYRLATLQIRSNPRKTVSLYLVSLAFAASVTAWGSIAAWVSGDLQRGLLFAIAGGFFSLRPVPGLQFQERKSGESALPPDSS